MIKIITRGCILFFFGSIVFINSSSAQPDYSFKSPTLISGADLQVGAVYSFPGVKPNVNAKVTIIAVTGGITLSSIDETWTGFDEAFQPFINVSPLADGYVEFNIDFLDAATDNPQLQTEIPVTCIDIDGVDKGDGYIYEKDQIKLTGYYIFDFLGVNLQVTNQNGWVLGENISGMSYGGVDTMAKDVMYTVVNATTSNIKVRIGARNTSPTKSEVRYRSVYFKKFYYGNFVPLPNRTLIGFSGAEKSNGIELKGLLSEGDNYDKIIIERGSTPALLSAVAKLEVLSGQSAKYSFTYFDAEPFDGNNYYRVKLINSSTRRMETSNILMVKTGLPRKGIELKNTIVQKNNPVITVYSDKNKDAFLTITDMSGRVIINQRVQLNAGINNIYASGKYISAGYGVLMIQSENEIKSAKIVFQ